MRAGLVAGLLGLGACATGPPAFPEGWEGCWRGVLEVVTPEDGERQRIGMQLVVEEIDESTWSWRLAYGDEPQVRDYRLVAEDAESGRWHLDEGEGVLLDVFQDGACLHLGFAVEDSWVAMEYRIEGDRMRVTTVRYGKTGEPLLTGITTLPVMAVQHAALERLEEYQPFTGGILLR